MMFWEQVRSSEHKRKSHKERVTWQWIRQRICSVRSGELAANFTTIISLATIPSCPTSDALTIYIWLAVSEILIGWIINVSQVLIGLINVNFSITCTGIHLISGLVVAKLWWIMTVWIMTNKTDNPKFYGELTESGFVVDESDCKNSNIFHYLNSPTVSPRI